MARAALRLLFVFVPALLILGWRIRSTPIGSTLADPIARVRAQDESMYVNSAMRITEDGDWLNPKLMGRLFLFKAPLIQWLTACSIRLFGLSLVSVRLASLLAGALCVTLVFAWVAVRRGYLAAAIAAFLLAGDPVWGIFSRLCFTDVLVTTLVFAAGFVLACDPGLERRRSRILFGVLAGSAVLAKSIAGVLPFAVLLALRPPWRRAGECAAIAFVVAAPWHIYQIAVHPQWFWIEYVKYQILGVGVAQDTGVTGYPFFYIRRLLDMDPLLFIACAAALPGVWRALRRLDPAVLMTVAIALALAIFRGRSLSYLVLLLPGLCVAAGLFLPRKLERWAPALLTLIAAVSVIEASRYQLPPLESVAALRGYYLRNRDTELFIAAAEDAFYAITLPGLKVRYCFVDAARAIAGFAPHYLELGIALTPAQLAGAGDYSARLARWGVNSTEAVGSAVLLPSPAGIGDLIRIRPDADFNLPAAWATPAPVTHESHPAGDRLFLLAKNAHPRAAPRTLPASW